MQPPSRSITFTAVMFLFAASLAAAGTPAIIATIPGSPGTLIVDSSGVYVADRVVASNGVGNGLIYHVGVNGGAIQALAGGLVQGNSGSYQTVSAMAFTGTDIIAGYGDYATFWFAKVAKPGNAVTGLGNTSGGYLIGTVGGSEFAYGSGFCCIALYSLQNGTTTQLIGDGTFVRSSLVDDSAIYYVDYRQYDVVRLDLATRVVTRLMTGNKVEPTIVANSTYVFATIAGDIVRAPKAGGSTTTIVTTGTATARAADADSVYFSDNAGNLFTIKVEGGTPTLLASGVSVTDMAQDDTNLYWTDSHVAGQGKIFKLAKRATTACPAGIFVGVRGSGEPYDAASFGMGATIKSVYDAANATIPGGLVPSGAIYDAIPALPLLGFVTNVDASVELGREFLRGYVAKQVATCPNMRIAIAGFSQGAMVASSFLQTADAATLSHIAAVALIGDPQFDGHASSADGDYDPRLNGVMVSLAGYPRRTFPAALTGRVISICTAGDVICGYSTKNLKACTTASCPHFHYSQLPGIPYVSYTNMGGRWIGTVFNQH